MHKTRLSSVLTAVTVFLIVCLTLVAISPWIVAQPGRLESVGPVLYPPTKTQGLLLQRMAFAQPNLLPVYGSSELTPLDRFHPSTVFSSQPAGFVPFLVGRGGCQSLVHLLSFAAVGEELRGKKLVLILSPQWFEKQGISEYYLSSNWSSLQAYQFALGSPLSPELKAKTAARLLQFEEVKKSPLLATLLRGLVDPSAFQGVLAQTAKPAAQVHLWFLKQLDKVRSTYLTLAARQVTPAGMGDLSPDTWTQLRAEAEQEAAAASTNNSYGMADEPFARRFAARYEELKGSEGSTSYVDSVEFADFDLLLRTLQELGADPLVVMVPVNGPWYDYIGFRQSDRDEHYAKTRAMVKGYGFKLADFSGHEYEQAFLRDDMHLGWKGWVYVDEAMARYVQHD